MVWVGVAVPLCGTSEPGVAVEAIVVVAAIPAARGPETGQREERTGEDEDRGEDLYAFGELWRCHGVWELSSSP